jgi:hypothetical protein
MPQMQEVLFVPGVVQEEVNPVVQPRAQPHAIIDVPRAPSPPRGTSGGGRGHISFRDLEGHINDTDTRLVDLERRVADLITRLRESPAVAPVIVGMPSFDLGASPLSNGSGMGSPRRQPVAGRPQYPGTTQPSHHPRIARQNHPPLSPKVPASRRSLGSQKPLPSSSNSLNRQSPVSHARPPRPTGQPQSVPRLARPASPRDPVPLASRPFLPPRHPLGLARRVIHLFLRLLLSPFVFAIIRPIPRSLLRLPGLRASSSCLHRAAAARLAGANHMRPRPITVAPAPSSASMAAPAISVLLASISHRRTSVASSKMSTDSGPP